MTEPGHYDVEEYQRTPKELLDQVCTCRKPQGYSHQLDSDYWVCGGCSKPSKFVAIRICDICEDYFIPKKRPELPATAYADVCEVCK